VDWFKAKGRLGRDPHVGDLVYYGAGGGTHVELVVAVTPAAIQTIGGNTSGVGVDGTAFFNGDGVYQKSVQRTSRIYGYGSPQYAVDAVPDSAITKLGAGTTAAAAAAKSVKPITTVRTIKAQQIAVNNLGYTPKLDPDGDWGPKTEAGVKWLQKQIGVTPDGQWGQDTEKAFKAFKAG
jgi:peptidoglycan hydrolase-like protein with peptidoglycan-binding domain